VIFLQAILWLVVVPATLVVLGVVWLCFGHRLLARMLGR
jgi:hypothetical protein